MKYYSYARLDELIKLLKYTIASDINLGEILNKEIDIYIFKLYIDTLIYLINTQDCYLNQVCSIIESGVCI